MNLTSQLLGRVRDHAKAKGLRAAVTAAGVIAEEVGAKAAALRNSADLTETGRMKGASDLMRRELLPRLATAAAPIKKARALVREERAAISIPAPDRADAAGALDRQEIRAVLRAMRPMEVMALLTQPGVDERLADAVLSAPAMMSGLNAEDFERVLQLTLERRFAPQMEAIRDLEDAVAEAEAAIDTMKAVTRETAGLDRDAFERIEQSFQADDTPWLLRQGDQVLRVVPGEAVYKPATGDELARGKFFASFAEYEAHRRGAAAAA